MTSETNSKNFDTLVDQADLGRKGRQWFKENKDELLGIVNFYAENGASLNLIKDPELLNDPMLIIRSMLKFGDKLAEYQVEYDEALETIARAQGVRGSKQDLAKKLEDTTVNEIKVSGSKLALALNGIGGSGKDSVAKRAGVPRIVNTTTRAMRYGTEEDGVDYHFLREKYHEEIDNNTGIGRTSGINRIDELGPVVARVHRQNRAIHVTTVAECKKVLGSNRSAFFIHGTNEVVQMAENLPKHLSDVQVISVSILAPGRGIPALASRLVARTYNDPGHGVTDSDGVFSINAGSRGAPEDYVESTMGSAQIKELADTARLAKKGIECCYIVNDDIYRAADVMRSIAG